MFKLNQTLPKPTPIANHNFGPRAKSYGTNKLELRYVNNPLYVKPHNAVAVSPTQRIKPQSAPHHPKRA